LNVASRLGKQNNRPSRWSLVLDNLKDRGAPCMNSQQWNLYLSGVAVDAMSDRAEAQRIARGGAVSPCAECSSGFRAEAGEKCQPQWFKEQS
jgi:hypothetical protein